MGLSRKEIIMITKTFKVKASTFRKLDDPFENGKSKKYVFYVKVDDVPDGIPMATNPREQKLTSAVARAIEDSLCSNDGYFHLKNRGIVVSASRVTFSNQKEEVTIEFDDNALHGNIDGGHTYKIVCEHKDEKLDQYVQFEVMTGVEEIIEDLARARNTSVQVDDKSMAELANKFDPIKEGLEGMPFFRRIAFKQNQIETDNETGKNMKMIDAREIVAIINMFDIDNFNEKFQPTQAYSSKAKMLSMYLKDPEHYRKFVNIAPDIFDLYDAVETEFAETYNVTGGRYGRKKYSGYKDGAVVGKSKFGQNDLTYKIPDGLLYPVVAAFRTLVVNATTGKYEWYNGEEPIAVWERCKNDITSKVMNFAASIGDNPNAVGKDSNIWDLAYMTVMLQK
jgi:hypothetical protein